MRRCQGAEKVSGTEKRLSCINVPEMGFLTRMALGLGVTSYGLTSYDSLFFNNYKNIYMKYRIILRNAGFRVK